MYINVVHFHFYLRNKLPTYLMLYVVALSLFLVFQDTVRHIIMLMMCPHDFYWTVYLNVYIDQ